MKGYKIGINADLMDFVLIELDIPEEYPGRIVYRNIYELINDPIYRDINDPLFSEDYMKYHIAAQCRSNVARVLDIHQIKDGVIEHIESAFSLYDQTFYYHPGEIIYPDVFDPNPDNICTNGIHFYENVEDAIRYTKDNWAIRRLMFASLSLNLQPPKPAMCNIY